jgi:hypothetical protein
VILLTFIIARNVFLLTAITHNPSSEEIERLWRTYYHFYVTSTDLVFVQEHCKKLLAASESMFTWNQSPFGASFKFSTEACLSEVRSMWSLYAQTRTKQQDVEVRHAIKSWYDRYIVEQDGPRIVLNGVRSAGAHGHLAGDTLNKAFHSFWETGVVAGNSLDMATLRQDNGDRVNPLMAVSSFGSFNVHYGLDPLIGFHLAEVFDLPQTPNETMNSLAHLVKSQFSGWCYEFASSVASSRVSIMHHCGDAVNFSHALQAVQGSATLSAFTYLYTKPWSSAPLDLPPGMVTRYDVIDTSNVMDHVGLLNLLVATVPLLSGRRDSVLYTESFLEGAQESEKTLETLLHSNVTMSSLLFGVAPVGYLLGTMTDTTHIEVMLDLSVRSTRGHLKEYRMRIPWKRAAQGDNLVPTIEPLPYRLDMDPHELASLFMQTYLSMFREAEDLSLMAQVAERKRTHPLAGDLGFYSRLSLVALLASAKRSISTDWRKCIDALIQMIKDDRALIVGSASLQEFYMHLHLSGVWHAHMLEGDPRARKSFYGGPRPAGEPGLLGQQSLPGFIHVAMVVPRSKLAVFTDRHIDRVGTPGLHLNECTGEIVNSFHAIDVFFGRFESDAIDTAKVIEDASGWSGTSDMIVTCKVPTWGLLVGRRQDLRIELVINTSSGALNYYSDLGSRQTVFSANLDSKNIMILTQAPCTEPRMVSRIEPVKVTDLIGSPSATVSLKPDGNVQSIGVTKTFAPDSPVGRTLRDGGMVELLQMSPCVLVVSIGEWRDTSKFVFPFPVDGAACKMKIARKSSWIEVEAPTSNALQPGGFNLDPFPIVGQGSSSLTWGMGRVDPELQPLVKISTPTPEFLEFLSWMAFSKGELAQVKAMALKCLPPMVRLKEVIAKIFSTCAKVYTEGPSEQIRMYIIRYDDTNKFHIVFNGLRHDRDTGSIFLDSFFIPDTADFTEHMAVNRKSQKCLVVPVSKEDMMLWQCLIPALAERCRSWEHSSDCKYKPGSIKSSVCDCGLGRNVEQMLGGYEDVAGYGIRIALPVISAVPYVECVVDEKLAAIMTAYKATLGQDEKKEASGSASVSAVCDNCGSDKPGLKACSRCEKVKYCNHACQKAAWKKHKKVCKR